MLSALKKNNKKEGKKFPSPAGNQTPVSRVIGGDIHHYTTEDLTQSSHILKPYQSCSRSLAENGFKVAYYSFDGV